ncbi:zinc finger and SCAN domain-containing protein 12 isoform X16 [Aethina tumida]|uniref:zinc finger and SCAN domain-containing protein 12 isoform X16 n=1 Tax=Aethina tumida TaxID=116153 RepID=UPI00096ADBB3|nr:zinc finger and SCAN domain-containing protein 12 isoform X16 [Aethina tumida]
MDNGGDILQLCRLCLVKDQVNIPIFEEQGDIRQIFLKISSCLPVKVTPDDKLPKKICDGCSCKLDMLYEFWNTTANAEKQLVSWLDQAGLKANTETADQTMSVVAQQVSSKPSETVVKEEAADEIFMEEITFSEKWEEASSSAGPSATITSDEPPPKRARRAAAVRASLNVAAESDDEDDLDTELTKIEDESEDEDDAEVDDPSYVDAPSTSADDQPGPSGVGKDGGDAPSQENDFEEPTNNHIEIHLEELNERCGTKLILDKVHESHDDDKESCNICKEILFDYLHFKSHYVGNSKRPPQCLKCDLTFNSPAKLKRHNKTQHGAFKCDLCDKAFESVRELGKHKKSHQFGVRNFSCDECDKHFTTQMGLFVHKRSKHRGIVHRCEECGKIFVHFKDLKNHKRKHEEGYVPVSIECELCGKVFGSRHGHKSHMEVQHEGKRHVCHICGKDFSSSSYLETHINIHNNVKEFMCEVCGKSFVKKQNLRLHERVHTKEKPHKCSICGKSYSQRSPLQLHIKNVHSKERPYQCHFCYKSFVQQSVLNAHLKQIHFIMIAEETTNE